MIMVVMGVAGAGKTYVGSALAARLGWRFLDADDCHPAANVAKMRAGVPLTDSDREPWLESVREFVAATTAAGADAVVACSALRQSFRQRLAAVADDVVFVYLRVGAATAELRARNRVGHFMPPTLVESQFGTLEEPADAIVVDAEANVDTIIEQIVAAAGVSPAEHRDDR